MRTYNDFKTKVAGMSPLEARTTFISVILDGMEDSNERESDTSYIDEASSPIMLALNAIKYFKHNPNAFAPLDKEDAEAVNAFIYSMEDIRTNIRDQDALDLLAECYTFLINKGIIADH